VDARIKSNDRGAEKTVIIRAGMHWRV